MQRRIGQLTDYRLWIERESDRLGQLINRNRLHGPGQHGQHGLQSKRLEDIVERPELHRIDGRLNRSMSGHHDTDEVRIDLKTRAHQREAIHFRHHQISKQHVKGLLAQSLDCGFARSKAGSLVALVGQ